MPEYNESNYKAAIRSSNDALASIVALRRALTTAEVQVRALAKAGANVVVAEPESQQAESDKLLLQLHQLRGGVLTDLDGAVAGLVTVRGELAPILDGLLGDYEPPPRPVLSPAPEE